MDLVTSSGSNCIALPEGVLFGDSSGENRSATLHAAFSQKARLQPSAVAVSGQGSCLTYEQLDRRSERLAQRLVRLGAGPEVPIALLVHRTPELLVAIVGILKAGSAYVPLDSAYPAERLAFLLSDCGAPLIVTEHSLSDKIPASASAKAVFLEDEIDGGEEVSLPNVGPDNLAYVIYTSGSTGVPKGVLVTHANVLRLFTSTQAWFHFGPDDVWTLFHSYAFDFSVWEIWGALLHGGRLIVVPWSISRSPGEFRTLLADEKVTVLNQTPTAFGQLMVADEAAGARLECLRTVVFGGEALALRSLVPWFARYGDLKPELVNMYGITETTVHVTYRPIRMADTHRGSMIGSPIPDLKLEVLSPSGEPVYAGEVGEMFVGGAGVARGYLNRPELTAERFIMRNGERYYRSGDLARLTPDGELEYLGRADRQIKLRGHRIELGEIESVLIGCPGVRASAVVLRSDVPGDERLVAYLVTEDHSALDESALRSFVAGRLPGYMVPAAFVRLGHFPLTNNGKLDFGALPQPEMSRRDRIVHSVAADPTEQAIADIWADLLRVGPGLDYDANFFDLGGHSLLLVRMADALEKRFGIVLNEIDLLEATSVRSLSARVRCATTTATASATVQGRAARQASGLNALRSARKGMPLAR
jgi:amino acid adenylation domain-containing protein